MTDLSSDERTHYLLTKRAAGFLVLEEVGAVQQAVTQMRALVADAMPPLSRAVAALPEAVDADTRGAAVRSLQFADMVDQLANYCHGELENVVQLARELNDHVNGLIEDEAGAVERLAAFQQTLEQRLTGLRARLTHHGHKPVVQQNMDEGDIELF